MRVVVQCSIFLLVGLCCAPVALAGPTNRYVSLAGGNAVPYDSWANAGTNLKTVVDYANTFTNGDTVWVSNGAHALPSAGLQITVGNTIVKSFNTNVAGTIFYGNGSWPYAGFSLDHTNAWLEGVTISNGSYFLGGGVVIAAGTLTNCVVRDCYSGATGGGISFANNGTGVVANCVVANNRGAYGGGVLIGNARQVAILNCMIVSNTAIMGGGVRYAANYANVSVTIDNCDICYNVATNMATGASAGGGGGIFVQDTSLAVTDCRIYGNTALETGGGIDVSPYSAQIYPTFRNCVISGNIACCSVTNYMFVNGNGQGGGGIFAGGGVFSDCTISGNVSSNTGGGIHFFRWSSVMSNCVIRANTTGTGGGAYSLYLYSAGARIDLFNCLISGNLATNSGGGMAINHWSSPYGTFRFYNCTIAGNTATGAGSVGGLSMYAGVSTSYLVNVIAYLNSGVTYSNWYGLVGAGQNDILCFSNSCTAPTNGVGFSGTNNTAINPNFVGPTSGNYKLIKGSPCINTGLYQDWMINAVDLGGHRRIEDGLVDMGAYEWFPKGTMLMLQ